MRDAALIIRRAILRQAKARECDPTALFVRFVHERFLWRLAQVKDNAAWALKGAMLLPTWTASVARFTDNLDLQHKGDGWVLSQDAIRATLRQVCAVQANDGLRFQGDTLQLVAHDSAFGCSMLRGTLAFLFGRRPATVQISVSRPAVLRQEPRPLTLKVVLEDMPVRVRSISPEIFLAEKLHIVTVASEPGAAPFTRLHDIDDMSEVLVHCSLRGSILSKAVQQTCEGRQTQVPKAMPRIIDPDAPAEPILSAAWRHYMTRRRPKAKPSTLQEVNNTLFAALIPMFDKMALGHAFMASWQPPGPWFLGE